MQEARNLEKPGKVRENSNPVTRIFDYSMISRQPEQIENQQ